VEQFLLVYADIVIHKGYKMRYSFVVALLLALGASSLSAEITTIRCEDSTLMPQNVQCAPNQFLRKDSKILVTVVGQGVAPSNTISPAQAYALAKRAAIADGYRILAEKVRGVEVEGQDIIKNMMVQNSTVKTQVEALIKDANVIETVFKDGLCEVEMEMMLLHSDFSR